MRGSVAAEARAKKTGMSKAQKAVLYGCVAGALVGGVMWSDAIQEQIDAIEKYGDHAPKYLGKQKTGVLVVTFSAALGFLAAVH
jgi:maleate cis-trans isomerase